MSFVESLNEALGIPYKPNSSDYRLTSAQGQTRGASRKTFLLTRKDDLNDPSNTENYADITLWTCKHGVKFAHFNVAGHDPYKFELDNLLAPPKPVKQAAPEGTLGDEDEFDNEYEDPEYDPRSNEGIPGPEDWKVLIDLVDSFLRGMLKQRQIVLGSVRSDFNSRTWTTLNGDWIECDDQTPQHKTGPAHSF